VAASYPDLAGRVVVVTMAATGIGAAVAEAFAAQRAVVAVTSRRRERLEDVAERIAAAGGTPLPVEAEVAVQGDVEAAVGAVVSRAGGIDVLVNNAGGFDRPTRLLDMRPGEWRECLDRNLTSALLWARAVVPHMAGRGGAIVNVGSVAAETCLPQGVNAAYGAAKGGVFSLTRHLARELAPRIRVNCVSPGATATPRWIALRDPNGDQREILGQIPLGRLADPMEQAWPVVFLASAAARHITGAILSVNGGRAMR
jgi:NAD(P)-dependent dehydrogenase (short-subunit alcohol dehydrogenase family)